MRVATWNVNSLRVRLPHLLEWLKQKDIDVCGLQETKLIDEKFPRDDIESAGYHVVFAGQPTYNGVAIVAKKERFQAPKDVSINLPDYPDPQVRLIGATLAPIASGEKTFRFLSAYVPNGSEVGSDKYAYKLAWLDAFKTHLKKELASHPRLIVVGDYNIAPSDDDVHDPELWKGQVLCSDAEREKFSALLDLGLKDSLRLFKQPEKIYSWWDYRQAAFRRNRGLRIDHLLLSDAVCKECLASGVDTDPRKKEQPSDHAPAWAEFHDEH